MARVTNRKIRKSRVCLYLENAIEKMEKRNKFSYSVSPDELARCLKTDVPTDKVYVWNTLSKIGFRTSLERIESVLASGVAKYNLPLRVENTGREVIIHR